MRCVKCDVDLGKNYQLCPLCSNEAVDEKPILKDIATAEYPDVIYRGYRKKYVMISFLIYIVLISLGMAFEKYFTTNIGYSLLAAFVLPNIWSFLVRPFIVKKQYIGSYLNLDVFFLSLLMLYISKISTGSFISALAKGIPILLITYMMALLMFSIIDRDNKVNSISYILGAGATSLGLLIVSIFVSGFSLLIPLISLGFSLLSLAVIKAIARKDFNEEFKARFKA
ncbi:MAG TPA: DUF6320 domain-containing protein [Clostridia bacterium]|nr:DUF6320 domain-containing protein [Clostridia bacterium]